MWLMTTIGMFSAVCPKTEGGHGGQVETDKIMVRARVRSHIEALQERFGELGDAELIETPHADYRFRIIVDKTVWTEAVGRMIVEQDYTNFKNAADSLQGRGGTGYVRALHRVWEVMYELQRFSTG
jgi:hypothetical protein